MQSDAISLGEQVSKRVYKHEGEPVLSTMLRRPSLSSDRAATKRIEEYYSHLAQTLRTRWEKELFDHAAENLALCRSQSKPFVLWEASLDFRVSFQDAAFLSIVCDISETRGDRRPLIERTAVTWDIGAGAPCTLKSFLPGRRHSRKRLLAELTEQAHRRLSSGESLLDADCVQKLPAAFSPDRFYLNSQGIAIFFPMYALAPFAEGIPTFHLPRPD